MYITLFLDVLDQIRGDLVAVQANFIHLDILNCKLNYANFFTVLPYVSKELKAMVSTFGHLLIFPRGCGVGSGQKVQF